MSKDNYMNIYHLLSFFFPEGKIKNKFRKIFYKISNSFTLRTKKILFDKENYITGKFHEPLLVNYGNCLEELKGYIQEYTPKEGDVVIDAGAFQGVFSVYASKLVGKYGKVIAFEPDEANYKLLKKNIRLNGIKNVILINKGLWNKNDVLKFKTKGPESCLAEFDKEEDITEKIGVVSLDEILLKMNINRVNFVKMDIEGAELKAVEGMKNTMKKNKIHFAIASYHEVNGEPTNKELEKIFKKNGYNVRTRYPKHLTTYAWKRRN